MPAPRRRAVPAYAGVPLTSATSPSLHVISGGGTKVDWTRSTADNVTVVVLGTPETLSKALGDLLAAGRDPATPVALTERGTTITQRTHTTTLGQVVALITSAKVEFPSLAVVGSTVRLREQLSWFETKPLFGWNILVPRTRDQAGSMTARLASYGATQRRRPHDQCRAAAHAAADGTRDQGSGHRTLRVDRVHLRQRRSGRS